MKQKRTWIVIADGAKARILQNTGRMEGVHQLPDSEFHDSHPPSREIMSERQPRVHESVGAARHAIELRTDPHEYRKQQFLMRLAEHLERAWQHGDFEKLIVVAPATALGELRKQFSPSLHKCLLAEIAHDYAHQSNDYVYQHIKDNLPL